MNIISIPGFETASRTAASTDTAPGDPAESFADSLALHCGNIAMLAEYLAIHRSGYPANVPMEETALSSVPRDSAYCAVKPPDTDRAPDAREAIWQKEARPPRALPAHAMVQHMAAVSRNHQSPHTFPSSRPEGLHRSEPGRFFTTKADDAMHPAPGTLALSDKSSPTAAPPPAGGLTKPASVEPDFMIHACAPPPAIRTGRGLQPGAALRGKQATQSMPQTHEIPPGAGFTLPGIGLNQLNSGAASKAGAVAAISDIAMPATPEFQAGLAATQALQQSPPEPQSAGTVTVPLLAEQWQEDFALQVSTFVRERTAGVHTARLQLNPPELGPLHISLSISDSITHAVFASPHATVRQAVENALPHLQQILLQQGLSLAQADVSDHGHGFGRQPERLTLPKAESSEGSGDAVPGMGDSMSASLPRTASARERLIDTFA